MSFMRLFPPSPCDPPNGSATRDQNRIDQLHENRKIKEKESPVLDLAPLEKALDGVLSLLRETLAENTHDEAMAVLALSEAEFTKPLSKHEVHVLACGLYVGLRGRAFTYSDVLELTEKFHGREMNITMIYDTIRALISRSLIVLSGTITHPDSERPSRSFKATELGRSAFKMAILNARILNNKHGSTAA